MIPFCRRRQPARPQEPHFSPVGAAFLDLGIAVAVGCLTFALHLHRVPGMPREPAPWSCGHVADPERAG